MNANEENKQTLIRLYLEKADRNHADADWLVTEKRYEIAAAAITTLVSSQYRHCS